MSFIFGSYYNNNEAIISYDVALPACQTSIICGSTEYILCVQATSFPSSNIYHFVEPDNSPYDV